MKMLDADIYPLMTNSGERVKDIVQFVKYEPYVSFDRRISFSHLSKEVLAEVPRQFMDYMKSKKILPKNKIVPNYSYTEE